MRPLLWARALRRRRPWGRRSSRPMVPAVLKHTTAHTRWEVIILWKKPRKWLIFCVVELRLCLSSGVFLPPLMRKGRPTRPPAAQLQTSGFSTSSSSNLDKISKPFHPGTVILKLIKSEMRNFRSFQRTSEFDRENSFGLAYFQNGTAWNTTGFYLALLKVSFLTVINGGLRTDTGEVHNSWIRNVTTETWNQGLTKKKKKSSRPKEEAHHLSQPRG